MTISKNKLDRRYQDFVNILDTLHGRFLSSSLTLKSFDGIEMKVFIDSVPYKIFFSMEKLKVEKHGK